MKNVTIAILLIATITFGGLYLRQTTKTSKAQATAEALQQAVTELKAAAAEQEKQTAQLREQTEKVAADAAARVQAAAQKNAALQRSLTNMAQRVAAAAAVPGETNSKPANPMAEMFKSLNTPEMKEMMKSQQQAVLGPMIDKNYGKLFADLRLSSEQSAALKELLLNRQLGGADMGMSLLSGDLDAAKRTELMQQVKAAHDEADTKIKEFLGNDNYAQFQTYEKSVPDRTAVSMFKDQLGGGATALTDDQEQQLVQAMSKERAGFKYTTDFSDQTKFNGDFASMLDEDRMNVFFEESAQLNQQYLAKAQGILSADQFAAYDKYLKNQQAMQKAGMQMAAKMFAPPPPK